MRWLSNPASTVFMGYILKNDHPEYNSLSEGFAPLRPRLKNERKSDIIDNENVVTYKTKKCYIFSIPIQQNQKCYLYENYNEIDLDIHKDILYEMSFEEFVNTFRTFIKYDGFIANDIPSKIIQDNIY
jgi:hypothetical protein